MEVDKDGRVLLSLQSPLISHKSVDCFAAALKYGHAVAVIVSELRPTNPKSLRVLTYRATNPRTVCTVDGTVPPPTAQSSKASKLSSFGHCSFACETAPSVDNGGDADILSRVDPSILKEYEKYAEQEHNAGLSVGQVSEDPEAETARIHHDFEIDEDDESRKVSLAVAKARNTGLLPNSVEMSTFGEASFFTPEEQELTAVESVLCRTVFQLNDFQCLFAFFSVYIRIINRYRRNEV